MSILGENYDEYYGLDEYDPYDPFEGEDEDVHEGGHDMKVYVNQLSDKCIAQIKTVLQWVGAYSPDFIDCKLEDLQDALGEYVIVRDHDTGEDMLMRVCTYWNVEDMMIGPRTVYNLHDGTTTLTMY